MDAGRSMAICFTITLLNKQAEKVCIDCNKTANKLCENIPHHFNDEFQLKSLENKQKMFASTSQHDFTPFIRGKN
jgi:hypothetical protein